MVGSNDTDGQDFYFGLIIALGVDVATVVELTRSKRGSVIRSSCFPTSITRRTTISSMRNEGKKRERNRVKNTRNDFYFEQNNRYHHHHTTATTKLLVEITKIAEKRIETGIEIRGAIIPELIGEDLWPRGKHGKTIQRGKRGEEEEDGRRKLKSAGLASCERTYERTNERTSEGKRTSRCRKRGEFELNLSRGS